MDPFNLGAAVQSTVTAVAKFVNAVKDYGTSYYGDQSLPQATKLTRVEPICVVSRDLLNNPELKTVLNSKLAIFAGHYLQAVDILTKVRDVEVVRILDKLNPDRDETGFLLSGGRTSGKAHGYSVESFGYISAENFHYRLPTASRMALEASKDERVIGLAVDNEQMKAKNADLQKKIDDMKAKAGNKHEEVGEAQEFGEISLDSLANLSLGKMLNVKIAYNTATGEERHVTLPVAVRLLVSTLPNDSIVRLLTYRSQDLSFIERLHTARSGRIEFIRDLVLCQDLIDEHKRASMQDPTNMLATITARNANAKKYGLLTKNPSLVAASTLVVMSSAVAREVENKMGGKLDNPRIREKIFQNTYAMLITVIDTEWESVTFYTRGIARGAQFTFNELEGKTKGAGPDVTDILKALTAGQPPSF